MSTALFDAVKNKLNKDYWVYQKQKGNSNNNNNNKKKVCGVNQRMVSVIIIDTCKKKIIYLKTLKQLLNRKTRKKEVAKIFSKQQKIV